MLLFQLKVQRTLNWVLSQDSDGTGSGSGNSGHSTPEPGQTPVMLDTSMPPPATTKPFTMPATTINSALDTLWTDKGKKTIIYFLACTTVIFSHHVKVTLQTVTPGQAVGTPVLVSDSWRPEWRLRMSPR